MKLALIMLVFSLYFILIFCTVSFRQNLPLILQFIKIQRYPPNIATLNYRVATEVLLKYRTFYRTHPPKIPYNTVHFQNKNTVHTVHSPLPVPYIPKKTSCTCTVHTQKNLIDLKKLCLREAAKIKGRAIKKKIV